MSQTRRRAASQRRSYADDDSMDIDAYEEHPESMDEDFEPASRAGRSRPATQPPAKRPRHQASQHPKRQRTISDYCKDTNLDANDSQDNEEANDDEDPSSEGDDEEDEDEAGGDRPGRPRSGARRRSRGRSGAEAGSRHGSASGRGGRGRGGRGGVSIKTEPGLARGAVGPAGGPELEDVICLISSSDTDGDVGGGGAGASQPPAKRGRGRPPSRGGRAAAGWGRGRGRGGDSDDDEDGLGDAAGHGEAGVRQVGLTQRQAYMAPTAPLQIDPEEVTRMRRLMKRYRDEWEVAKEKCAVWSEISEAERNQLAAAVVRFLLFSSRSKPQHPVPRAKLAEAVKKAMGPSYRHLRKLGSVWLPWARYKAISCMGLDIAELSRGPAGGPEGLGPGSGEQGAGAGPSTSAAAATGGGEGAGGGEGSGQYFVLRTALPTSLRVEFVGSDGAGEEEAGLRLAVLALIHYNRGKMDEDMLLRLLGQMGFDPSAATHPRFPPLHDLLKKWTDQRYLALEKETGADGGTVCTYCWGDAAHSEVTPAALTKMCDQLLDSLDTAIGGDGGGGAAA